MNNENITKWVDELSTTDETQATGALLLITPEGDRAYCCLGFGSCITMPSIDLTLPSFDHLVETGEFDIDDPSDMVGDKPAAKGYVGEEHITDLAPIEFVRWLGYDIPDVNDDGGRRSDSYDIYPDWPVNLRVRHPHDLSAQDRGGDPAFDHEAGHLCREGVAGLNDNHFTFKQIADVVRFFGLSEYIEGNTFDNTGEVYPR